MFKTKLIISITVFVTFLVITSTVKNKTRIIEKKISNINIQLLDKQKDINQAQLDFYYLTSPAEIEKKLNLLGFNDYFPIKYSNIFLDVSDIFRIISAIFSIFLIYRGNRYLPHGWGSGYLWSRIGAEGGKQQEKEEVEESIRETRVVQIGSASANRDTEVVRDNQEYPHAFQIGISHR